MKDPINYLETCLELSSEEVTNAELIASLSKDVRIALDYLEQEGLEARLISKNVVEFDLLNKTFTYSHKSKKWKENGKGKWYSSRTLRDAVEKIKSNNKKRNKLPIFSISNIEENGLTLQTVVYEIEEVKQLGSYTAYKLKNINVFLWSTTGLTNAHRFNRKFILTSSCSLKNRKEYVNPSFV